MTIPIGSSVVVRVADNINGKISLQDANSEIEAKANISLGNGGSGAGAFNSVGKLDVETTMSQSLARCGSCGSVEINGGELSSGAKLTQATTETLSGKGDILAVWDGKGTITASGDMTIGEGSTASAFIHTGTLNTGANTVTLQSLTPAALGALTNLGGGTLTSASGVLLSQNDKLSGTGTVEADVSASGTAGNVSEISAILISRVRLP